MRRSDGELLVYWTLPVLAVIWLSAFFLFPGFTHRMAPTMSADDVAAFYQDHTARIRYSMIVFNWFCVGLIPILMLIVLQMRRMAHRTPILAYCVIGSAAAGPTLFLTADLFWLIAAFRPERSPEIIQLFNDLGWITFTCGVPFLIAQSIFIAVAIYLDRQQQRVFPTWVGHLNLVVAATLAPAAFSALTQTGVLAWNGFLSFWVKNAAIAIWIVVMWAVLGRAIRQERAQLAVTV
ncbi:MAG: hypothetical protein ABR549_17115 [Mycobacteriales bacterium]